MNKRMCGEFSAETVEEVCNADFSTDYAKRISEMVYTIKTEKLLKLIYGFVKSACNEEKAGE